MNDTTRTDQEIARALSSAGNAVTHAGQIAGGAMSSVAPALHEAAERISDIAHQGMASMREGSSDLTGQGRCATHKTASSIRPDPLEAGLVAGVLGAGAMALYKLLQHAPDVAGR